MHYESEIMHCDPGKRSYPNTFKFTGFSASKFVPNSRTTNPTRLL